MTKDQTMVQKKLSAAIAGTLAALLALGAEGGTLETELQAAIADLSATDKVDVIIRCADPLDLATIQHPDRKSKRQKLIKALRAKATLCQKLLAKDLAAAESGNEKDLWLINSVAATVRVDKLDMLARRRGVDSIGLNAELELPPEPKPPVPAGQPGNPSWTFWNLSETRIPDLWALGHYGLGVVVATLDTGVDLDHLDLGPNWRGGTNSWFDPNGQHDLPYDANGHGTGVMGLLVGGNSTGVDIGAAPGAQWIAAKIFNDAGVSDLAKIHQAYQWILDPDGNPATDDTPDIVNNSWALPQTDVCYGEFAGDITVLRAADIVVVFSAGNFGDAAATSVEPANNPGSLSVGAVDYYRDPLLTSSRGPSACGGGVYPGLVAPGQDVFTTGLTGGGANPSAWAYGTGTSFAAPHVAGAMAVLKSAVPGATAAELESAILGGALDLGVTGADNDSGAGYLDAVAAYTLLAARASTDADGDGVTDALDRCPGTPAGAAVDATGCALPAAPSAILYLSLTNTSGTLSGLAPDGSSLAYTDEDILSWNGSSYAMVFDGSAAGLPATSDIFAFDVDSANNRILMAFRAPLAVPGITGTVEASDVVAYSLTTRSFSLFFDGSDVGLDSTSDRIDAFGLLPDGRLLFSTVGGPTVPGLSGVADEDLLVFTPASLGASTSGTWALYFDGSDVRLNTTADEDVEAAAVDGNGRVYLSTLGDFSVSGLSGQDEDVFVCTPTSLGPTTACSFSLFFDGTAHGLSADDIDAIDLP